MLRLSFYQGRRRLAFGRTPDGMMQIVTVQHSGESQCLLPSVGENMRTDRGCRGQTGGLNAGTRVKSAQMSCVGCDQVLDSYMRSTGVRLAKFPQRSGISVPPSLF